MRRRRSEKRSLPRGPIFERVRIIFKVVVLAIGLMIALASDRDAGAETRRAVIDAPDSCHPLKKVERDAVFLESTGETCLRMIGKVPVEVDSSVRTVRIYVDGRFWREQELTELDMEEISKIAKRAEEMAADLKVLENRHRPEMQAEAGKLAGEFHSEGSQKKLEAETERIKEALFKKRRDQSAGSAERESADSPQRAGPSQGPPAESRYLQPDERIYLFVSSSVPMTTLRNYASDLSRLADPNISMVMRGMIGGMKYVRPTTEFVSKVIVKDANCKVFRDRCDAHQVNFVIDPLLFRKYRITQVPAVVYAPRTGAAEPDRSEGLTPTEKEFYVLYGDASLEYLLETLRRETKSRSLGRAASALSHQESPPERER
ncbi:TrbC family F-type conjugative pilus assembly protein [Candidatus Manganitrophus noduliformans]|uniref:Type-F conjugative transfer system pilin assembly protein TrbC n=1 Tax=Candidatus Manganitrophus noduliformans TaxID=2606439 RepID=A0A7X6IB56_9BACT|nr:type-F conjugative transfer system pilin assembly protein TrbC [Candidatus Manganitrophus noduliformans]NKE71273.1 hypothetical protein [Candidatus Manganitrophus noduliformans]